mmetsp:Transcript_10360/g.18937  ORF Transcript_10360/g.18937 Transcript_10360/m.18937 type:complete len:82 (-) Transcript_10360:1728-1973(-)
MNQPMWLLWLAIVAILSDGGIEAAYPECGLKDDDFKIIYDEKSCTRVCDDCTGSGCNATSGAQFSQFNRVSGDARNIIVYL